MKRATGLPRNQSVAAAAVEVINAGRGGKKLPSWFREDAAWSAQTVISLLTGAWALLFLTWRPPTAAPKSPEPSPAEAAMTVVDAMRNLTDIAEGQRADLERRGFSPAVAEMVAAQLLVAAISSGGGK